MADILKTEAVVINTARWQESSKIAHLYSAEAGYLKLIARGALRPKSDFRGTLEVLNHLEVLYSYKSGRSLQVLTGTTLLNPFMHIREDLNKTAAAFSMLELIKKLLPVHEPMPEFFTYLVEMLQALDAAGPADSRKFLWQFLFRISSVMGFAWNVNLCRETGKIPARFPVYMDTGSGSLLCPENIHQQPKSRPAGLNKVQYDCLQELLAAAPNAIERLNALPLNSIRPDLVELLLRYLGHHSETRLTLNSLKWFA